MSHHPIWWTQQQLSHSPPAAASEMMETGGMEPMFEKTLTPSDVGKLNRLVIPKQHAEKYFRIGGGSGLNSGIDSGVLLSFEDECGKCWKFRYSYWNSSQSYVLTKGWSRYVKEKVLEAGDMVVFSRLRADMDRIFIGFQRRMKPPAAQPPVVMENGVRDPSVSYPAYPGAYLESSTHPYQPQYCPCPGAVVPRGSAPANENKSKILRLFGVNVECHPDPPQNDEPEPSLNEAQYEQYSTSNGHTSYPYNYMEYNMSGDQANQMRYPQG